MSLAGFFIDHADDFSFVEGKFYGLSSLNKRDIFVNSGQAVSVKMVKP